MLPFRAAAFAALAVPFALAAPAAADPARWAQEGWATDFTQATVPFDEIVSGGPPKDGIPSIDDPVFEPASAVDIPDREPVIVFPLGENARAYPLRVLMWHEIVNDEIDGAPVAVTYCPLCNAAVVFDRAVDGRTLEFGTTGKLRHSDLVMYDRETESWWQQFTGEAIAGDYAGTELDMLPSRVAPFSEFRTAHPEGPVLVPNDPSARRYGANPYAGYDTRDAPLGLFLGQPPEGMPAMAHVVVARGPQGQAAVALAHIAEQGVVEHRGVRFAWRPGKASALDTRRIADGRDLGFVTVTDASGEPVVHDTTFAFALDAFDPDADVLTDAGLIRLRDGAPAEG
ncbi:DUF3179 domain-containing protein [Salinarimonas sp.]|uniref:DUF3179 domain-containing protein n=1 Tax=Salinarimonas sp. TaxID=2766526 RepID=UPI0032D913C2